MKPKSSNSLILVVGILLFWLLPSKSWALVVAVDGINYYLNSEAKTAEVYIKGGWPSTYSGDVIIPESFIYRGETYIVTGIDTGAFRGCENLTSVTIPNSVTIIRDCAIIRCPKLTSITIPRGVSFIENCDGGFLLDCPSLTSINVDANNKTYDSRNNCNAIIETSTNTLIAGCKNTIIPSSVSSIGRQAFEECTGLTSVTIPNSVNSIHELAFSGCTGLTSVEIPNSVNRIGESAFDNTPWYDMSVSENTHSKIVES